MVVTSKRLNLLPQLLPLQEILKIAAYMIQNRCTFYDKHKRQLEDFQDIEEIFSDV